MAEAALRLVVGLGNPAASYAGTRHNVGRDFIDHTAQKKKSTFSKSRQADTVRLPALFPSSPNADKASSPNVSVGDPETNVQRLDSRLRGNDGIILFAKLKSFMNESGPTLQGLLAKEGIKLEETLIVVDDFMIPFGTLRLRSGGSAGGHNGLKSIIETFGTEDFPRLRVGIGPTPEGEDPAEFVLKSFSGAERKRLPALYEAIEKSVAALTQDGFQKAMSATNKSHL